MCTRKASFFSVVLSDHWFFTTSGSASMSLSDWNSATAPERYVVSVLFGTSRSSSSAATPSNVKPFFLTSASSTGAGAAVAFDGAGLITAVACSENVAFGIRTVPVLRSTPFGGANSPWMTNSGSPATPRASSSFSFRPRKSSSITSPVPVGVSASSAALSWSRTRALPHCCTRAVRFLLVGSGRSLSSGTVSPSSDAPPPTVSRPSKWTSTSPSSPPWS